MRIGYPCINRSLPCQGDKTFRLKSYSEERLVEVVGNNLDCLAKMLEFNAVHRLLFLRITSELVPFASHPVCRYDWQRAFRPQLRRIGSFIRQNRMRISMHPDQFVLINSLDEKIFSSSVRELEYHCEVLDGMGLDPRAKVQIHVGGVYGDKEKSLNRFVERYRTLDSAVRKRLVIENDHRSYSLGDCLRVHEETGAPVIFDNYHHEVYSSGETNGEALRLVRRTWAKRDGLPMVDYSSGNPDAARGTHAETIDMRLFRRFLEETRGVDFDVMLEIKDKEKSALKALRSAASDPRLF